MDDGGIGNTAQVQQDRVNSLLEAALWELANENETQAPDETDALDSLIDAARMNVMGGLYPEEAELMFGTAPLGANSLDTIAARAAELRQIHQQVAPAAALPISTESPIPTESPVSVEDALERLNVEDDAVEQSAERDAEDSDWEEWPSEPPAPPAPPAPPTPAERAAAAAQRLAEERETRLQRNGGTMRNRAAEIEAEKAAEAVLANLP